MLCLLHVFDEMNQNKIKHFINFEILATLHLVLLDLLIYNNLVKCEAIQ